MSGRVINFSAGPSALPVEIFPALERGIRYADAEIGVMELSHRSPEYEAIHADARERLRRLLAVPESHEILLMQGGATQQFGQIAMQFGPGAYVVNGSWGEKAYEAARAWHGDRVRRRTVGAPDYRESWSPSDGDDFGGDDRSGQCAYRHMTTNETIQGVQTREDPDRPAVADMSSDILTRRLDWSRYRLAYAGAQKNLGPSGVTVVVIEREFMADERADVPEYFRYGAHAKAGSLLNTPPTWSIFVLREVLRHWESVGGIAHLEAQAVARSERLYGIIDASEGFFEGHARPWARSRMNVTFRLPSPELTRAFLTGAEAQGMVGLAGHRSVGGVRASLYNACPMEWVEALGEWMTEFVRRPGSRVTA
ncbi:MAG: 3-phosphoserine/phosphohydroxythreonine transaminase [Fimbriimonadaceae bacterium]|nr:3-phosphoserine/phosphohydroxythreonine transaminase [Fimbriimonadaceae bacterium]